MGTLPGVSSPAIACWRSLTAPNSVVIADTLVSNSCLTLANFPDVFLNVDDSKRRKISRDDYQQTEIRMHVYASMTQLESLEIHALHKYLCIHTDSTLA